MPATNFAAIDLGAESGRVILGTLSDKKFELSEMNRLGNGPVRTAGELSADDPHAATRAAMHALSNARRARRDAYPDMRSS